METASGSESEANKRQLSDGDDLEPQSKKLELDSSEYRFIPVGPDITPNPEHYLALIIPRALKPHFESLVQQAIRDVNMAANAKLHNKKAEVEDSDSFASELKAAEFVQTFSEFKDILKNKLHDYDDNALRGKLQSDEGFSIFKDYRTKISRWYESGQHLLLKLTGDNNSRNFVKTHISFSPAVSDKATMQSCELKIQQATKYCEINITDTVIEKAFDLTEGIKKLLEDAEKADTSLKANCFFKAFRGVIRRFRSLDQRTVDFTIPNHSDRQVRRNVRKPFRIYERRDSHRENHFRDDQYREDRYPTRTFVSRRDNYHPQAAYEEPSESEYENYSHRRSYSEHYKMPDDEYPPPQRQYHDYRRFKRRPYDYYETDEGDTSEQPNYDRRNAFPSGRHYTGRYRDY
jgi:hypothetical protein